MKNKIMSFAFRSEYPVWTHVEYLVAGYILGFITSLVLFVGIDGTGYIAGWRYHAVAFFVNAFTIGGCFVAFIRLATVPRSFFLYRFKKVDRESFYDAKRALIDEKNAEVQRALDDESPDLSQLNDEAIALGNSYY